MYFILLTDYSNYVVFDEALALLDQHKKSNSKNQKKSNILEVASLRSCAFKSIHIAISTGINKAITHENNCLPYICFVLLFLSLIMVDLELLQHLRRSYDFKEFHLICGMVQDLPLKSIDKVRKRQYYLFPVFKFH